jgi:hypothetical protein
MKEKEWSNTSAVKFVSKVSSSIELAEGTTYSNTMLRKLMIGDEL